MRCLVVLVLAAGCTAYGLNEGRPEQSKEEFKDIPVYIQRDLDVLFVIDDSASMAE